MSRLDELIRELCPNGVVRKAISEVTTVKRGVRVVRSQLSTEGQYPVYQNALKPLGYHTEANSPANTVFVICAGAAGDVGYSKVDFWAADDCHYCTSTDMIDSRYLYHVLLWQQDYLYSQVRRGSIPRLSRTVIEKMVIPIPPLPIQREIVKILDNFTELTAELLARKKQYEYFATKLYSQTEHEMIPMSELASFVYGYTDKAQDHGDARFIRITDINEQGCLKPEDAKYITLNPEAEKSLLSKGDLVMARTGATYGKTLYFDSDEPSVYASFLIKITPHADKMLNRYYWHFTKTPLYWEQANKLVTTGGQPQFNTPAIKQVKVPIPSLEEQKHVVDTLDRLDALCNDLSSGLPAEIAARQKQYEYYRDKLLTFESINKQ